jgi:hypothetical protein
VVYSLAPLVDFFADIEPTSLFRWTIGTQPLTEGVSAGYLLLSLGVAAALTAISTRIFDRRDITV